MLRTHAFIFYLLTAFAAIATAAADVAAEGAAAPSPIVARWQGGELTEDAFRARYDPDGKDLRRGGRDLENALCKAVFQEIYAARARELGLTESPELAQELAAWRQRVLAARYRSAHAPDFASQMTPEALRAFYAERTDGDYLSKGEADLEVLFLRCSVRPQERAACRERAAALDARLAGGEAFSALVAEERAGGSEASGVFKATPLATLSDDLAAAVAATPIGGFSSWVEMPHGLFRFHVTARTEPHPYPYADVATRVRRDWLADQHDRWQQAELRRLGTPAATPADVEAALAAAAVAEGRDREPEFLAKEEGFRRWWLADQAFYRDAALFPDAAALAAFRTDEGERLARLHLRLAKVAVDGDRSAALRTAGEVAELLDHAEDPAAALAEVAARRVDVQLEELGPLAVAELRALPLLRDAVADLEAGGWRGPLPLSVDAVAPALAARSPTVAKEYRVLAFVAVLGREAPADDALRRAVMEQLRSRISTGADAFLAVLGPRWQIELSPPPAGGR